MYRFFFICAECFSKWTILFAEFMAISFPISVCRVPPSLFPVLWAFPSLLLLNRLILSCCPVFANQLIVGAEDSRSIRVSCLWYLLDDLYLGLWEFFCCVLEIWCSNFILLSCVELFVATVDGSPVQIGTFPGVFWVGNIFCGKHFSFFIRIKL